MRLHSQRPSDATTTKVQRSPVRVCGPMPQLKHSLSPTYPVKILYPYLISAPVSTGLNLGSQLEIFFGKDRIMLMWVFNSKFIIIFKIIKINYFQSMQTLSPSISAMLNQAETSISSSLDTDPNIQSIFELDKDCNVVLQGKIGQVCKI